MSNQDDFQFDGFDIPGTTPVPDVVFDKLLSRLTGNELKVLLYIIRRTYGFGKNADAISLSQFREGIKTRDENGDEKVLDEGCGIGHNRTILVALTSLEQKGCVTSKKRNTHAGDSDTTIYKLRFKNTNKKAPREQLDNGVVTSGNHVVTPSNEGSYSTSPRWLPQVTTVVTSGNTQETVLQYTDKQETVLQKDTFGASLDSAALTQLQEKNHNLEEELAAVKALLKEVRNALPTQGSDQKGHASPTTAGQNDTPLTPAGRNTPTENSPTQEPTFPQSSTLPENQEPHVLDNASSEPPNRPKTGIVEAQPVSVPTPSVEAPKTAIQTQAVNGTSNQGANNASNNPASGGDHPNNGSGNISSAVRRLPENQELPAMCAGGNASLVGSGTDMRVDSVSLAQQASSDDPIATGATKKSRGVRSKKAEKPAVDAPPKITPVLTEEEKAYKERCAGIYNQMVKRRGHEFNTGDDVKAERTMIRDHLAKKFTDAQIDRIHRYLVEEDKYWKLPENRVRISALVIWRESNEVSTLLRERREEEERKKKATSSQSAGVTPLTQRMRAMKEQYLGSSNNTAIAQ